MDISPVSGEFAYLDGEALMLADPDGGWIAFTLNGRLLFFSGQLDNYSCDEVPVPLSAARKRPDVAGKVTHDSNSHPIVSAADALWAPDGSLAILRLQNGDMLVTFPFSARPNAYLPIRGDKLRWGR